MNYEEFLEEVRRRTLDRCKEGDTVTLQKVEKNNGLNLEALVIRRQNQNTAPTIYLKRYFEDYQKGKELDSIVDTICYIANNCCANFDDAIDRMSEFEKIRSRIYLRLINTQKNTKMLEGVPYFEFLDLSAVCYILFENTDVGMSTCLVRNDFLAKWKIDKEELFKVAKENSFKEGEATIIPMSSLLRTMLPNPESQEAAELIMELEEYESGKMYVISNERKTYGAVQMLNERMLQSFGTVHGDFYILPSSIHELIFITGESLMDSQTLLNMVCQVNATELQTDEILSDSVYFYDHMTSRISRFPE